MFTFRCSLNTKQLFLNHAAFSVRNTTQGIRKMPTSRRRHWGTSTLVRQMLQATCTVAVATSLLAHAGQTTNKIGITMVDIPAGSFMMGSCKITSSMAEENKKRAFMGQVLITAGCSNLDSDAEDNETPQHRVSIRKFQIGKTEVTLGQFKQYIAAAGRSDMVDDKFIKYNNNGDDAPVRYVNWYNAQSFIDWLNKTDGGGYRLPTESEWEYACRAGGNSTYCGGDSVGLVAWYSTNSGGGAHAVGTKQGNAFGLFARQLQRCPYGWQCLDKPWKNIVSCAARRVCGR